MPDLANNTPRVVVNSDSLAPEAVRLLIARGARIRYLPTMAPIGDLVNAVAEAPTHAIISRATPINAEVMDAAAALKVISKHGVGYDNVDLGGAAQRGIAVMKAYGTNARSVAELALTLMLILLKRIFPLDASVRAGRWERSRFTSTELAGKHLGIIGCGAVGGNLVELCRGFGMRITICDPYLDQRAVPTGVERVDRLDELLERVDIVTLHCPLTAETQGLIGATALAQMKPTALLINTARGPLVDEIALIAALKAGRIAGAGLDTFVEEPPGANNPLWHLPNVVFTPHVGGATTEALSRVAVQAVENIFTVLDGKRPDPLFVVTA